MALAHFQDSLAFYGDHHGVKIFRKHLGWYIDRAPRLSAEARRAARGRLCRMNEPHEVERGLMQLWAA